MVGDAAVPELVVTVPFVHPVILRIVGRPASKRARVEHGKIVGKPLRQSIDATHGFVRQPVVQSMPQLMQGDLHVLAIVHAALSKGKLLDVARVVRKIPSVGAVRIEVDAALVEHRLDGNSQLVVDVAHGAVDVIVGVDGLKGRVRARETKFAFRVNNGSPGTAERVEGGKGVVLDVAEDDLAELRGETRIVVIVVVAKARASVIRSPLRDVVVRVKVVASKVVQTGGRGGMVGVELRNKRTSKQSYEQ